MLPADTAPLPLYARCLVALLHVAGLVDDPDRVGPGILASHHLLETIPRPILVPVVPSQELLQVSRRNTRRQGDRLAALLPKVRQLALHVRGKMVSLIPPRETVIEPLQVTNQLRLQLANLIGVHAKSSLTKRTANRLAKFAKSRKVNPAQ